MERFVASPCSDPDLGLDEVLVRYSGMGFCKFEAFSSWAKSAFDVNGDPAYYRQRAEQAGLAITSFHLPPVEDDDGRSLDNAIRAAGFARSLGAEVVLFKAASIDIYIASASHFLDGIASVGVLPVLQNHFGTAISTLDDFERVLAGIGDDRMMTLLEVGHFHSAGVSWREGYALLKDSMALVHIKDQVGRQSVPFGTGEVDLPGLFKQLQQDGYRGNFVVEMEVADKENTERYLIEALQYLHTNQPENESV
jgi:sugar phosphate isomerase/epimerase